jgi:hypothetical protein
MMKRYYLQDGDAVVAGAEVTLVKSGDGLVLSDFDRGSVPLAFHWRRAEPYPVLYDGRRPYVEVDDDTFADLNPQ